MCQAMLDEMNALFERAQSLRAERKFADAKTLNERAMRTWSMWRGLTPYQPETLNQ